MNGFNFKKKEANKVNEPEILALIEDIPPLSDVVSQIISIAGSQSSSVSDLDKIVEKDMLITGKLLQLVNSPFYALKNSVTSVKQSVAIVGMNSLKSLVIAASVSGIMNIDLKSYGYKSNGLWENSIMTAALARAIALEIKEDPDMAEDCFVAGLMRDAGILVLGQILERRGLNLAFSGDGKNIDDNMIDIENGSIKFNHVWVAEKILEQWKLPRSIIQITSYHHTDPDMIPDEYKIPVSIIKLAERLVNAANVGLLETHLFPRKITSALFSALSMSPEEFKVVLEISEETMANTNMKFE